MSRCRRFAAPCSDHRICSSLLLLFCTLAALLLAACGGRSNKHATRNNAGPQPRVSAVPSATGGRTGGGPEAPAPRPSAPGGAFVPGTPAPSATCAPDSLLRLVDKEVALPSDYVPSELVNVDPIDASPGAAMMLKLRRDAADAMHQMLVQARLSGLSIVAQSAYRSYDDQSRVYQAEVQAYGQAQADRESARPGHSEHQLGVAVDFSSKRLNYDLNDSFAATAEGKWLQQNAAQYGFVLSYPQGKEEITEYTYEPWHFRYVGPGAAQALAQSGLTLREWLAQRQVGCPAGAQHGRSPVGV